MKKKTLILLGCAIILLLANACSKTEYDIFSNISGTVIDADNSEPIGQVEVTLSPSGVNTVTNNNGHFGFKEIEAQSYTITVQKTGYQSNRKTVEAPSGETVNISITMKKQ